MKAHDLIDGRRVSLAELNAREQAFLTDLQRMARQGVSYFEVYRTAVGPGSPALQGRNRIDRRIVGSPLYLVARDIATRVGIRQGLVLAPEHQNETAKAPKDAARKRSGVPGSPRATEPGSGAEPRSRSMMSVAQASDLIGITRAAVYKAIEKRALETIRIGNVTLVDRASAQAYREQRESIGRRESHSRRAAGF